MKRVGKLFGILTLFILLSGSIMAGQVFALSSTATSPAAFTNITSSFNNVITGTATADSGNTITKVEVSVDDGSNWIPATDTSGDNSWSTWSCNWNEMSNGQYSIISRATENTGVVESIPKPGYSNYSTTYPDTRTATKTLRITSFNPNGNSYNLNMPNAVAVDEKAGHIYLADNYSYYDGKSGVLAYDMGGNYLFRMKIGNMTVEGIGVGPNGNIYVTTGGGGPSYIMIFASDGTPLNVINVALDDSDPNNGCILYGVAVASSGRIFVCNTGTNHILIYNPDGSLLKKIDSSASGFYCPWHISINKEGYLVFTDTWSLFVYDQNGNFVRTISGLNYSYTPACNEYGAILSDDPYNGTGVTAFSMAGKKLYQIQFLDQNGGLLDLDPGDMRGMTIDSNNRFYYTEVMQGRVTVCQLKPAGVPVTVNIPQPSSCILTPIDGSTINDTTIAGTASDGSGRGIQMVEVSTDGGVTWKGPADGVTDTTGGTWTPWRYDWTPPSDGAYTIMSRVTDNAGNQETPEAGVTVLVDKTPPVSTITAPANNATEKGYYWQITGTATDGTGSGVKKVEVSIDGGATWNLATGTTNWSYSPIDYPADGSYTIMSRATDNIGNVETNGPSNVITILIDNNVPGSLITNPSFNATLSGTTYTITGNSGDGYGVGDGLVDITKVELSTDGGNTWNPVTVTSVNHIKMFWSYTWTLPISGNFTIMARATDLAGNVEVPYGVPVTVNNLP